MDGDGGGTDAGGMGGGGTGSMNGEFINQSVGDGTGGTDDDSGTSALQSLGYIESGAGTEREDGDSTRSVTSVLKTIVFLAVGFFFVGSFLYFLLSGILAFLGVQL